MTFESVMNVLVPIAVFVIIGGMVLLRAKEPIMAFFQWIKEMFSSSKEKSTEAIEQIVYR